MYQKVIEKNGGSFLDHLLAFSFSTVLTDVVIQSVSIQEVSVLTVDKRIYG